MPGPLATTVVACEHSPCHGKPPAGDVSPIRPCADRASSPQRSKKVRLYPALLQQLAKIQQQAFSEIEQPKIGLFDKILGSKTYHPKVPADTEPDEVLAAFLLQFYLKLVKW